MARVNATALSTTSGKRPVATVLLEKPIDAFSIPTVSAECVLQRLGNPIKYGLPEEVQIIEPDTQDTLQFNRVPVLRGSRQMWTLWAEEEKKAVRTSQKAKCVILRQNSGALVAQHMLARLLAVDELVSYSLDHEHPGKESVRVLDEWKIRWCRDWFKTTYDEAVVTGSQFLKADPIPADNRAFFETDWNIDEQGKNLLYPPPDLAAWFDGEIEGLNDAFKETLKSQALASLGKVDAYTETHYDPRAKLPERWHEEHRPPPRFWSVRQWDWLAKGNSIWEDPVGLLFFSLKENPDGTFHDFKQVLSSLLTILLQKPDLQSSYTLATQLWMGEIVWREFAAVMLRDHLNEDIVDDLQRWEQKDPANAFNTLEARLLLDGYVHRHDAGTDEAWNEEDRVLWAGIAKITTSKYEAPWQWIVSKVASGKKVTEVLRQVGPWWTQQQSRNGGRNAERQNQSGRRDGPSRRDDPMGEDEMDEDQSGTAGQQAKGDGAAYQSNKESGPSQPDDPMGEDQDPNPAGGRISGSSLTPPPPTPTSPVPYRPAAFLRASVEGYTDLEKIARQYTAFLTHREPDLLEADLREILSENRHSSIEEYLQAMKAWAASEDAEEASRQPTLNFFARERAAQARQEAEQERQDLL